MVFLMDLGAKHLKSRFDLFDFLRLFLLDAFNL